MTSKKTPEKRSTKKVVEEIVGGERESSSKFDDVFDVDYSTPPRKVHRSLRGNKVAMFWELSLF